MRKVFVLLFLVFGFAFLFQVSAEAKDINYDEAVVIVDNANLAIEAEIDKALEKEALLTHDENYDEKLDKIIDNLLEKTTKIADKTIDKLAKDGIVVICIYEPVLIGDREVMVDPLRVHSW